MMARVGYEFRAEERQAEAMVSGPFTDTLSARFAVQASQMDGWNQGVARPIANPGAAIPGEPALLPGAGFNLFLKDTYVHPLIDFLLPQGQGVPGQGTFSNVSPEATITWNPTPDWMVYGAYKTGYKSGGYARPVLITPNFTTGASYEYKLEKVRGG
jgi:outer membrane receptor protein involved in Fe transport